MISSIKIAGAATYSDEGEVLEDLKKANFFFGSNGVGKTTISRFMRAPDDEKFSNCALEFQNGQALRIDVFNRDFVSEHFETESGLKGIYTLGDNVGLEAELRAKRSSRDDIQRQLVNDRENLKKKQDELETAKTTIVESLWKSRGDLSSVLKAQSMRKLFEKFEARDEFFGDIREIDDLLGEHEALSDKSAQTFDLLEDAFFIDLETCLSDARWKTPLVGAESSQIAGLIKKTGHGDWVHQGQEHLESADGDCPFCQQTLPSGFEADLKAYFDESYREGLAQLADLKAALDKAAEVILSSCETLQKKGRDFLDEANHHALMERLRVWLETCQSRATQKWAAPSTVCEFPDGASIRSEIAALIENTNSQIKAHNELMEHRSERKKAHEVECWAWLADQVKAEYAAFIQKRNGLSEGIDALTQNVSQKTADIDQFTQEIADLERQQTSIEGAVSSINQQLTVYGFQGFKLEMDGEYHYHIVREDGSRAKETLSEGERSFIAFLYFYYLVHGAHTESGAGDKRVVVIDDPVTSMDSNVMMIVVHLVRELLREAGDNDKAIQQVFVLTHNAHFHGQVAYKRHGDGITGSRSYWMVRKADGRTSVERYDDDPVKNSYDLLWDVVRARNSDAVGVQNAMRRILEHYFKLYEGLKFDEIIIDLPDEMKGPGQVLISFLHDGSHNVFDDFLVVSSDEQLDLYRQVFHRVFKAAGQEAHYKRQMGEAYVELPDDGPRQLNDEDKGILIREGG